MTGGVEFFRHGLAEAELASVAEVLQSVFLATGPVVGRFEESLAESTGVEHAVGVSSCSMGLILSLAAFGVGHGDEVITTSMTFVATVNAILHRGATPVLVDVEPDTGLIDARAVEAAITARTRAIIPVHLYGQLADMAALRVIADRHGLVLIEDSAHALGATRDGYGPGAVGDAAVFSFYATKVITSGDGGAVVVHDRGIADRLKFLRNHGITKDALTRYGQRYTHWDQTELGYKAAMTDLEAALLLPQLAKVSERRSKRDALVTRYRNGLEGVPGVALTRQVGASAHHLFTVLVSAEIRDTVLAGLGDRSIGCAVNYRAVHTLTYFKERLGLVPDDLPHAKRIGECTISLPLWSELPPSATTVVVEALVKLLSREAA